MHKDATTLTQVLSVRLPGAYTHIYAQREGRERKRRGGEEGGREERGEEEKKFSWWPETDGPGKSTCCASLRS